MMTRWQWSGLALAALALGGAVAFQQRSDLPAESARAFLVQLEHQRPRPVAPLPEFRELGEKVHFKPQGIVDPFRLTSLQGGVP